MTASSNATDRASPATEMLKNEGHVEGVQVLRAGEDAHKIVEPERKQTKSRRRPLAKRNCTNAWEAGQIKNTTVMAIWGATRM